MKLRLKYSLQIILTACLLLLGSCGKKNTVNSNGNNGTSPFYIGNPALSSSPQLVNQVQSMKSSTRCMQGARLTNDVSFYINGGSVSGTTIGGNWQSGFMSSGTINSLYVGVGVFGDLLFVTKVTNGGQVVGYNATLSFCGLPNPMGGNFPALISDQRALINFQAPSGIVLDTNTYCGYGVIDYAGYTSIVSQRNSNPYSSQDFQVITSFTKPLCNGQF